MRGRIQRQFEDALGFILRNIHWKQGSQGVNSTGIPEIPRIVLEELLANALMHRDYIDDREGNLFRAIIKRPNSSG